VLPDHPTLGLLLAIEGARKSPRLAAHNNALAAALSACRERGPVLRDEEGGSLLSAAFFPDGKRVLTTSHRHFRIWDRASGKLLTRWQAPLSITSSSISPDGRYVVVTFQDYQFALYSDGSRILHTDTAARLWDTKTNKETVLRGHENRVVSARFSPDSKRVITASWDHTARIWDPATGEQLDVLKGHPCALASAGYSADGKTIFTVSSGRASFSTVPAGEFKQATTGVDLPVPVGANMVAGHSSRTGNGGMYPVGEGDDGVDAVVAPVQFHDHQHPAVALRHGGPSGSGQEAGDGWGQGEKGRVLQEIATGKHG